MDNKRIGIFQTVHPVQVHTCNLIKKLLDHGYAVDIFLYDIVSYYDVDDIEADKTKLTVNIYGNYVSAYDNRGTSQSRLKNRMAFPCKCITFAYNHFMEHIVYGCFGNITGINTKTEFFNRRIIKRALSDMSGKKYVCLIGIEKAGLIWSGIIAERLKIPNIYYSLELYTEDHQYFQLSNKNKNRKKLEEIYHKRCHATIIQDRRRAEVLYTSNGVNIDKVKPIYLPVSSLGGCMREKTHYCYDKWDLDTNDTVILYSGLIGQFRWIDRVIDVSKKFPQRWKLLLHGVDVMETQKVITQKGVSDRVILSTTLLPPSELIKLVLSAKIGLVIYANTDQNDILTGFSSEKLSVYLQCGIPVIAFRYPSYEQIKDYQCGILIDSIEEIPNAITKILENFSWYQENAYKCFEEVYEYSKHFMNVTDYIDSMP